MRAILLLLIPFSIFSQVDQQSQKIDSTLYHIALNIAPVDHIKAEYLSDSLYVYTKDKRQRIRIKMLSAYIFEKNEKRGRAIVEVLKVLEIAKENNEYLFLSKIYIFLSKNYRLIGFTDKGKYFLNKALEINEKISNNKKLTLQLASYNLELAEYAIEEKNFRKAIDLLKLAILKSAIIEDQNIKTIFSSTIEEKLANCYMLLNEKEKALSHYYKAKANFIKNKDENSVWATLIYQGLGNLHLQTKSLDSANFYLKKALSIVKDNTTNSIKPQLFKSLSEYYKQINEIDSFYVYNQKYNTVLLHNIVQKKLIINRAYNTLNDQPIKKSNNLIYFVLLVILLSGLVFVNIFFLRKDKINSIKHKKNVVDQQLSKTIEADLIKKIKEFEDSNLYLDKNISLHTLIDFLNTNAKYFRNFLKKHKNTDYTTYINQLRIHYIKEKLTTNKKYLNYKISYLANECGFSSHSKFSSNFKNITGLSPSEFIKEVRNKSI